LFGKDDVLELHTVLTDLYHISIHPFAKLPPKFDGGLVAHESLDSDGSQYAGKVQFFNGREIIVGTPDERERAYRRKNDAENIFILHIMLRLVSIIVLQFAVAAVNK